MMMSISWMDGLHQYRPDLLFWIPNFIYQGIGCWLFIRNDRGRKFKDGQAGLPTEKAKK
jgi:hypothetical protein